jgi:hypothetical protein
MNGLIWYLLCVAFTIGTGWYNALLSNRAKLEKEGVFGRTVVFFLIQHFAMPFVLLCLVMLLLGIGSLIG